jgi:hypothetical protein
MPEKESASYRDETYG